MSRSHPTPDSGENLEGLAESSADAIAALSAQNGGTIRVRIPDALLDTTYRLNVLYEPGYMTFVFREEAESLH